MQEFLILKENLKVPENLYHALERIITIENAKILVHISKEFLSISELFEKLKNYSYEELDLKLKFLYLNGFLDKKVITLHEAFKYKDFYNIIQEHLEEAKYDALGLENLEELRNYYITTRIQKTEAIIKNGALNYSSKVIPISKVLDVKQQILPKNQAIKILKECEIIALTKCGCRLTFNNCNKPLDVCLSLNEEAKYFISRGIAEKISCEKAEKILEVADNHGLVHLTLYLPGEKVYGLCSCCSCCCHELQGLLKYNKKFFISKSDYITQVDSEICKACKKCIEICVFKARITKNKDVSFIAENCYGCGLCVSICPNKAIKLTMRK